MTGVSVRQLPRGLVLAAAVAAAVFLWRGCSCPSSLVARAVLDGGVSPWLAAVTYVPLAFPGQYWHLVPSLHHGPQLLVTASQTWGAFLLLWILAGLHDEPAASAR